MTDKLLEGLANQGAMGVLLAILLWLFIRFFNKMFDSQVERDRSATEFMRQCLSILQELKSACLSCRAEITTTESLRLGASEEKIIAAVNAAGQLVIAETRRDNDLSRPNRTPTPLPLKLPYNTSPKMGKIR